MSDKLSELIAKLDELEPRVRSLGVFSVKIGYGKEFANTLSQAADLLEALRAQQGEMERALRELSQVTLACAQVLNKTRKGEGCDLSEWNAAAQRMDSARKQANALLAKLPKG